MDKIGFVKVPFEKSRIVYTYQWKFNKYVSDLKQWGSLVGQDILESGAFTFDTGILQNTKHSMKAYFIISKGEIIVKAQIGKPSVYDEFTHSDISLTQITADINLDTRLYSCNPALEEVTKEYLETYSLESTLDKTDMTESFWNNCLDADTDYYSTITLHFAFEYTFWRHGTIKTKIGGNELTQMNALPTLATLDTKFWYQTKQLTDFVIYCEDSSFKAHKMVLADRSPVFAAMFEHQLTETQESKMIIKDADPSTLKQFLKFLYTGTADLEKYAADLFLMADKYSVNNLKKLCELQLINSATVINALDLYNLGRLANSVELTNKCIDIMKRNKKEMLKTPEDARAFLRDYPFAYRVIFD